MGIISINNALDNEILTKQEIDVLKLKAIRDFQEKVRELHIRKNTSMIDNEEYKKFKMSYSRQLFSDLNWYFNNKEVLEIMLEYLDELLFWDICSDSFSYPFMEKIRDFLLELNVVDLEWIINIYKKMKSRWRAIHYKWIDWKDSWDYRRESDDWLSHKIQQTLITEEKERLLLILNPKFNF